MVLLLHGCNTSDDDKSYLRHVGDIPFDHQLDDPSFHPCNEDRALVYYNFGQPDLYKGEKPAIEKAFEHISLPSLDDSDGYITIRFMINCEGKTGRFRVEQLDNQYKTKQFNPELVDQLLITTQKLDGWIPGKLDGRAYDYYKYLTFKIIDNQIVDILP